MRHSQYIICDSQSELARAFVRSDSELHYLPFASTMLNLHVRDSGQCTSCIMSKVIIYTIESDKDGVIYDTSLNDNIVH